MKKFFAISMLLLPLVAIAAYAFGFTAVAEGACVANLLAFAIPEKDMTPEQKQLCGTIMLRFNEAIEQFKKGMMSAEEIKDELANVGALIDEKLKNASQFAEIEKNYKEQADKITEIAETFDRLKEANKGIFINGVNCDSVVAIEKAVGEFMDTNKFNDYINGRDKSSGEMKLEVKGITNVTGNTNQPYTQNRQTGKVITEVGEAKLNLRDLMTVDQGDPTALTLSWEKVTHFDRNATVVSENGMLEESSLKFEEETTNVKRIGTHMNLSKRLLKSKTYLVSFILNRLPAWIKMAENYQIMFGDGSGDNLKGITKYDGCQCVSKFISGPYAQIAATGISKVEATADNKQAIITLKDPNDKVYDGAKVTFAGATTNTGLNETFDVHKMNDRQFAVDFANAKAEAAVAAMTAVFNNGLYKSVDDPNAEDVINAIYAVQTFGQFTPNVMVLNPMTVFAMSTAKDTTGRKLGIVEERGGVKYIGTRPVVEYNGVPVGYYFTGDLANGAALVDYTALTIEFADDVNTKLKNMTTVIAQEEIMMPVYMPFAFAYGKLADVETAIKK